MQNTSDIIQNPALDRLDSSQTSQTNPGKVGTNLEPSPTANGAQRVEQTGPACAVDATPGRNVPKRRVRVWLETDREKIRARFGDRTAENETLAGVLSHENLDLARPGPNFLGLLYHSHNGERKRFNVFLVCSRRGKQVQTHKAAVKLGKKLLEKHGWEVES